MLTDIGTSLNPRCWNINVSRHRYRCRPMSVYVGSDVDRCRFTSDPMLTDIHHGLRSQSANCDRTPLLLWKVHVRPMKWYHNVCSVYSYVCVCFVCVWYIVIVYSMFCVWYIRMCEYVLYDIFCVIYSYVCVCFGCYFGFLKPCLRNVYSTVLYGHEVVDLG